MKELVSTTTADCPFCHEKGVLYCDVVVNDAISLDLVKSVSCVLMCKSCGRKFGFGRYLDGRYLDESADLSWISDSIKSAVKNEEK